jgi:cation diffusion facilitator family transporter
METATSVAQNAGKGVGRRSVVVSLAANLAVAASKLVGFLLTGSASLLAETLHSVADTGNQILLLLGAHLAEETPSPRRPFGRGRERYFWAFIVGLVLFGLGGLFSLWEGYQKLTSTTHEIASPAVGIALIVAAAIFEGTSLRSGLREADSIRPPDQSWWRFIRRTRSPEVTVVVVENGAALIGLALALVGLSATWISGAAAWDGATTVAIGALLCIVAGFLTAEMKSLLIGETVSPRRAQLLEAAIEAVDGVDRILNLRTEHLGPEQVLVCAKIALDAPADLQRVVEIIDAVEVAVHDAVPETLTCYVEPDIYDPQRASTAWT